MVKGFEFESLPLPLTKISPSELFGKLSEVIVFPNLLILGVPSFFKTGVSFNLLFITLSLISFQTGFTFSSINFSSKVTHLNPKNALSFKGASLLGSSNIMHK